MRTFLPLRSLSLSLPPLLLSSSKSGALSPTSSARAAELAAATKAIANAKENMSLAVDFIASSFLTKTSGQHFRIPIVTALCLSSWVLSTAHEEDSGWLCGVNSAAEDRNIHKLGVMPGC